MCYRGGVSGSIGCSQVVGGIGTEGDSGLTGGHTAGRATQVFMQPEVVFVFFILHATNTAALTAI